MSVRVFGGLQGLPHQCSAPHKAGEPQRQRRARDGCRASSTADIDEMLAEVTGPGGRLVIDDDEHGRAIVGNFPATLPDSSDLLRPERRQRGGGCRRRALHLRRSRPHFGTAGARARRHAASRKGDRVGIAMRNCPSWIVATWRSSRPAGSPPCSTAGGRRRRWSMRSRSTDPKLIIADAPRAERIAERAAAAATSSACRSSCLSTRRSRLCSRAGRMRRCPKLPQATTRRSSSPRARRAMPRARCPPIAR